MDFSQKPCKKWCAAHFLDTFMISHWKMRKLFYLLFYFSLSNTFASEAFLHERLEYIRTLLPKKVLENLPQNLKVKRAPLNFKAIESCSGMIEGGFHYGNYLHLTKTLRVDKNLIKMASKCGGSFLNELDRTLVHELFHSYELTAKKESVDTKGCPVDHSGRPRVKSALCKRKLKDAKRRTPISTSREFYLQAQLHGRNSSDFQGSRSLDPYELENAYEFAAVNFEGFILDKEYKCRRPSFYKFFAKKFNFLPNDSYECKRVNFVYSQLDSQQKFELDPKRVYQIQYFHASEGDSIMSGFGHSMLRVVLCAPKRKVVDEKCLYDLDYHVILSFRGEILESTINPISGVFGDYPSKLFVFGLKDIIFEYNTAEFRHLYGYPLKFSESEKETFLERTLETFWEYEGSYKFVTQNCATETYKLIVSSLDSKKGRYEESLTPNGVLEDLFDIGLIDAKLNNLSQMNLMNVFKSKFGYFNTAHKVLFGIELGEDNVLEEIESIYEKTLALIYSETFERGNSKKVSAAYIIIKRFFDVRYLAFKKIEYAHLETLKESDDELYRRAKEQLIKPFDKQVSQSYGIPSKEEFTESATKSESKKQIQSQVRSHLTEVMKSYNDDLLEIIKNLKYLRSL